MDWKEIAKLFGIIVAAGAVSAVVQIMLTRQAENVARAAARAELQSLIAQAAATRPVNVPASSPPKAIMSPGTGPIAPIMI